MKNCRQLQNSIVAAMIASMLCSPVSSVAAENTERKSQRPRDIELADGGVLKGQIVNPAGTATAEQTIVIHSAGQMVAGTTSASDGTFTIHGLKGGTYQIVTGKHQFPCRLWARGSAPPLSQQSILLVTHQAQVRGQFPNFNPVVPSINPMAPWATAAGILILGGIGWGIYEIADDSKSS
ncbi:MAG: carboxypeptidase-like regulatory domain-containing protein [Planctomycetales bacterium]